MIEVEQQDLCFPSPVVLLGQALQKALNQLADVLAMAGCNTGLVRLTVPGRLLSNR
jgi:hypothetical protein